MSTPFNFPIVIYGDPVGLCINILRNSVDVLALVDEDKISSNLLEYQPTDLRIEVVSGGGWRHRLKPYKPRIDFYCYAPRRSVAHQIAGTAEAVLLASIGYESNGLFLCDARSEAGITEIPDRLQELNRQFFSLRLTVTPRP